MKRVLLFALGAVLLAFVGGAPAAQASVAGVGWWSDAPTASAPAGGIAIGANPSGPAAVAAVVFDLGKDGASRVNLSLHQSGGAAPAGASIVACVVGTFTPVEHGPMADAPATVCEDTSTPVKVSGDGVTWSADLSDLVGDKTGKVGIALVPGAGASLFDLQFDTVSGSVTANRSSTATTTATRPSTSSSPSPATSSSPSPRPAPSTFTAPSAPSVAAPSATTTTVAGAESAAANDAATEAASAATEVAAGGSVALPTAASTGVTSEPSGSTGQALGYALLAAVIGLIGGLGHKLVSRRFAV